MDIAMLRGNLALVYYLANHIGYFKHYRLIFHRAQISPDRKYTLVRIGIQ